jgi:glycosyltransferase involved in cell wall biosynthesis
MNISNRFPVIPLSEPISILMPVSNEADVIEAVINEWISDVFIHLPEGSEFLFDEAASTDGTREILEKFSKQYHFIKVEYHNKKDGFANATRRLYKKAKCPWIFFTDSDGQYIAKDFWKLAKFIKDDYDLIRGAKIGRKDPIARRLLSSIYNKLIQFLFNMNYLDFNSAFFLIKHQPLNDILKNLESMQTLINTELLLRLELENYKIKQVYILHRNRQFGFSRGLAPKDFIGHSIGAIKGLYKIKSSYRK